MPAAQVERLSQLIHEVMKDPDTRRKFEATKLEPVAASRAQTEATLKAYIGTVGAGGAALRLQTLRTRTVYYYTLTSSSS